MAALAELKAKLAQSKGKPGYAERAAAIEAEIVRIEGAMTAGEAAKLVKR